MTPFLNAQDSDWYNAARECNRRHNWTFKSYQTLMLIDCPCGEIFTILQRLDEPPGSAGVRICECGDWHSILFK